MYSVGVEISIQPEMMGEAKLPVTELEVVKGVTQERGQVWKNSFVEYVNQCPQEKHQNRMMYAML